LLGPESACRVSTRDPVSFPDCVQKVIRHKALARAGGSCAFAIAVAGFIYRNLLINHREPHDPGYELTHHTDYLTVSLGAIVFLVEG